MRASKLGVQTAEIDQFEVGFGSRSTALVRLLLQYLQTARQVRRHASDFGADAVHAASARALFLALLVNWRRISTVAVRDVLPRNIVGNLVRLILRCGARSIVFNSKFTRAQFGSTWPAHSRVLYPYVAAEDLLRLPLRPAHTKEPKIGVLGQITPWKGQDDAIAALEKLHENHPRATLWVIGDVVFQSARYDNERFARHLRELAKQFVDPSSVKFLGNVDVVRDVLPKLDVLLVPSWQEPFGRVVVEGMAAGVPVVATDSGGPAEIISHEATGLLVPARSSASLAKAVDLLLTQPALYRNIQRAGRARARDLTLARDLEQEFRVFYTRGV